MEETILCINTLLKEKNLIGSELQCNTIINKISIAANIIDQTINIEFPTSEKNLAVLIILGYISEAYYCDCSNFSIYTDILILLDDAEFRIDKNIITALNDISPSENPYMRANIQIKNKKVFDDLYFTKWSLSN